MTLVSFVLDEFTVSPPLMDVYMRLLSAPGDSVVQYDSGIRSVCVCVLYCVPTQEMQLKPPQLQLRTIKTKVIASLVPPRKCSHGTGLQPGKRKKQRRKSVRDAEKFGLKCLLRKSLQDSCDQNPHPRRAADAVAVAVPGTAGVIEVVRAVPTPTVRPPATAGVARRGTDAVAARHPRAAGRKSTGGTTLVGGITIREIGTATVRGIEIGAETDHETSDDVALEEQAPVRKC
eukprot:m.207256 g.207256  ORF g.207256 m.207256 type:complete len:232 (-) comp18924_c0_seq1:52-747(-)